MRRRRLLMVAAALVACAKTETKPDSAAPAAATPATPAATTVTAADVAGTWNGQVMAQGSDSVLFKFVCVQPPSGTESRCVNQSAPKDTTVYTYALSGDSVMWTSKPYKPASPPKSPEQIDHVVGRMSGSNTKWAGTVVSMLASKPDSVLGRVRWEATKTP